MASTAFSHYPFDDQTFIKDWQTELDLLSQGIRAQADTEARDLARKFLDQRSRRRQKAGLSSEMVDIERLKEWEEGMAKYAELSTYRLAATTEGYQPAPEILHANVNNV
jgi:hypothetical protein